MFDWLKRGETAPAPRKGMPSPRLDEAEFKRRYREQFYDPAFDAAAVELDVITEIAWQAYAESRKSPRTAKAGEGFADPDYDLSLEWIAAKKAIDAAQKRRDAGSTRNILIVNGSSRSETHLPRRNVEKLSSRRDRERGVRGASRLHGRTARPVASFLRIYGRDIHPCKACFSTAAPLCIGRARVIPTILSARPRTG